MSVQSFLHAIDGISTWIGKAAAWLIVVLMTVVCVEVFKRYIMNMPTSWIFDLNNMLYGSLFMLCGAYTLAQNAHVRGDFLYSSMRPRTQATLDLILYIVFFFPGIAALIYAGYFFAEQSWRIARAFQRYGGRAAGLPLQVRDPDCRRAADAAGLGRNRAVCRLPADRRVAEPAQGRRRDRRDRGATRAQRIRRRGSRARSRSSRLRRLTRTARQRGMGGDLQT